MALNTYRLATAIAQMTLSIEAWLVTCVILARRRRKDPNGSSHNPNLITPRRNVAWSNQHNHLISQIGGDLMIGCYYIP